MVPSACHLQMQIDRLRADIFADFTFDDEQTSSEVVGCYKNSSDIVASDTDLERELAKSQERIAELEAVVVQNKQESEIIGTESADKLAQSTDQVAHLEGRIRELVDRENQLNMELERRRLADHQRTLEQNQQIVALRAEVDEMRGNESSLRDNLTQTTTRCNDQLSRAKSDNTEAVGQLTLMLQENQAELLNVLTELETARRQLEVMAGKLDRRSAQLEDALNQVKVADESVATMQQNTIRLRKRVGELESERSLLSERVAIYEQAAVDGVVGTKDLIRQTLDLENRISERDGTVIQLESDIGDLRETIKNSADCKEALVHENDRLRQQLDSATTDQLQAMAALRGKLKLFEQVFSQKDREISNLRTELASRKESGSGTHVSGSSFGKIVAASADADDQRRLARLQDVFREVNSAHADEVSSLNKQLEQASADMQLFKLHAKKQFEEQQEKV